MRNVSLRHLGLAAGVVLCSILVAAPTARAEELVVCGWNLESGGADGDTLARVLRRFDDVDLFGFSEVEGSGWARKLDAAATSARGDDYRWILGKTGRRDRLCILYNEDRFEELAQFELDSINPRGRYRAPLVAKLRDRRSGQSFYFMVNHLARGNREARHDQSRRLNRWVRSQDLPVIAVGDYNYDWSVRGGDRDHDDGYDELTDDDVMEWVRPDRLKKTHCSDYDSVLDFVFVSGGAKRWDGESWIGQGHRCPDDRSNTDHQPVFARFDLPRGRNRGIIVRAEPADPAEADAEDAPPAPRRRLWPARDDTALRDD